VAGVRVLHLTDTHLSDRRPAHPPRAFADAVHAFSGRTTGEAAALVVEEVGIPARPDLVLHTGDVADEPSAAAYAAGRELLARIGAPALVTAGNHDDAPALAAAFGEAAPVGCGALDLGRWRIVTVCSARLGQAHGHFGAAVLGHLDELLDTDRPTLVGTHHPPVPACPDPDCTAEDAAAFLDVVDRHPNVVAVASGHLHLVADLERNGVRYLASPSTCLQLVHVHPLMGHNETATPIGARVIDLHDDGGLDTEVAWAPSGWPRRP
jgi:Icc protein